MLNSLLLSKLKKVAITGNIGSGKSTVSKIFAVMGVPVFYADIEARLLYYRKDVKQKMAVHFGNAVFNDAGEIDRQKLANIIFSDKTKLKIINSIIHPLVFQQYAKWLELHKEEAYTLHESAILFENKLEKHYDLIVSVTAPPELRISRIMKRDGVERKKVKDRMKHQWSEAEKNRRSDFVIINDGVHMLIPQVIRIDNEIRKK
jgi:dephospho-CoA kinase